MLARAIDHPPLGTTPVRGFSRLRGVHAGIDSERIENALAYLGHARIVPADLFPGANDFVSRRSAPSGQRCRYDLQRRFSRGWTPSARWRLRQSQRLTVNRRRRKRPESN
jgi:hypothetical protein